MTLGRMIDREGRFRVQSCAWAESSSRAHDHRRALSIRLYLADDFKISFLLFVF